MRAYFRTPICKACPFPLFEIARNHALAKTVENYFALSDHLTLNAAKNPARWYGPVANGYPDLKASQGGQGRIMK